MKYKFQGVQEDTRDGICIVYVGRSEPQLSLLGRVNGHSSLGWRTCFLPNEGFVYCGGYENFNMKALY